MASEQQFSGRTVAGRYRLGPRRGSGIDAAVFDAFDVRDQRIVSLQVVHPDISTGTEFAAAFRPTMEIAAGLTHPNIAAIHDFGSDDWKGRETFWVAVEHLAGGSLRDVLDRGRTLSPSQTLAVGLDALRALEVVHRAGLVHGDVRPSTLVFGHDRKVRLIDVGLGQLLARTIWSDLAQVSNERAMYAAPEVAARQPAVPKSDVYSLCLTMLECVTRHVPFVGDSTVATLSNRIGRLLPVSADLGALAAVLERAGRPEPDDRFSVAEFGQALVRTTPKLPRPAPIPVLGAGLFDLDAARAAEPVDADRRACGGRGSRGRRCLRGRGSTDGARRSARRRGVVARRRRPRRTRGRSRARRARAGAGAGAGGRRRPTRPTRPTRRGRRRRSCRCSTPSRTPSPRWWPPSRPPRPCRGPVVCRPARPHRCRRPARSRRPRARWRRPPSTTWRRTTTPRPKVPSWHRPPPFPSSPPRSRRR